MTAGDSALAYQRREARTGLTTTENEVVDSDVATEWIRLDNDGWPGSAYANVDYVLVGPRGVFVINSLDWAGEIIVKEGILRQNGRPRVPAVTGAERASLAVTALVPESARHAVVPVICFERRDSITGRAGNVLVTSASTLTPVLDGRSPVLNAIEVDEIVSLLRSRLPAGNAPRRKAPARGRRNVERASENTSDNTSENTDASRRAHASEEGSNRREMIWKAVRLVIFIVLAVLFYTHLHQITNAMQDLVSAVSDRVGADQPAPKGGTGS